MSRQKRRRPVHVSASFTPAAPNIPAVWWAFCVDWDEQDGHPPERSGTTADDAISYLCAVLAERGFHPVAVSPEVVE